LLGLVNEGMTQSATAPNPSSKKRAMAGQTPSAMPRAMYSGSQPSMQTTTVGRWGKA